MGIGFLVTLAFKAGAAAVPDEPAPALEPGLEADERLGAELGWADDHTLFVTAQAAAGSEFWERKVVRVDARTGEVKEVVNPGTLACTNPTEKLVSMYVGSDAKMYAGRSSVPLPEIKLYDWDPSKARLNPKNSGNGWNPFICRKTNPAHENTRRLEFLQKDVRYLEAKDGYLTFSRRVPRELLLVKAGKTAALDATPREIAPFAEYLPFRDSYLLAMGRFTMRATMADQKGGTTTEFPLLTMTSSGSIHREIVRPLFERAGLRVEGQTHPYAGGTLVLVSHRPASGGGIYAVHGESITRIWCTNGGNTYDRVCRGASPALSPNGCRFAFFAKGSDNLKSRSSVRPTLKILSLCR